MSRLLAVCLLGLLIGPAFASDPSGTQAQAVRKFNLYDESAQYRTWKLLKESKPIGQRQNQAPNFRPGMLLNEKDDVRQAHEEIDRFWKNNGR